MTDLKDQLERLLNHELVTTPGDIERVVAAGRSSRRRRTLMVGAASTLGVAGLVAAVAIPVLSTPGNEAAVQFATQPGKSAPAAPSHAKAPRCYIVKTPDGHFKVIELNANAWRALPPPAAHDDRTLTTHWLLRHKMAQAADCQKDAPTASGPPTPSGPPYTYSEEPSAISARLGGHLHDRVTGFGLSISYTRPFAQETTQLESGHPSYFSGNVDVQEASGYGDIGVQVTHKVTTQVPFDNECTAATHCEQTTLPDGSVLQTGQVDAGGTNTVLTAEIHRPDGVVVQAQESNYPFGPDAGSEAHGNQPLTLEQLTSLAEDAAFTF